MLLDAGGHGEDIGVEDDVFGRKADRLGENLVGTAADLLAAFQVVGLAFFVEGHHHHGGAVFAAQARVLDEGGFAFLHRNRVDHRLTLHAAQPGFDHRPFGGVDHHRHAADVRLRGDQLEEGAHRLDAVEHAFVHVDVDDLRAGLDLLTCHRQSGGVVAVLDQVAEPGRAGDVGALADIAEIQFGRQVQRFQTGEAAHRIMRDRYARRDAFNMFRDMRDVLRRGAAAAADQIHQPRVRELLDDAGGVLRVFVVLAEGIRQAGVRVAGDVAVGEARQLLDVRAHFLAAERAVQADGQRPGVAHRVPEGFGDLTRQGAAGGVGDRAGQNHRPALAAFLEQGFHREDRGLGVERVEDRFDHEQVHAAVGESACLFEVGVDQFLVGNVALAGIVHVRADAGGAVGRAQRAGDEARALRRARGIRRLACDARGGHVDFVGQRFHAVVGLGNLLCVEGVGLDDVAAGREIFAVNLANDVRLRDRQQIVVALDVAGPVRKARAAIVRLAELVALDHRAHGAVEHQDALAQLRFDAVEGGRGHWGLDLAHRKIISAYPHKRITFEGGHTETV